MEKEESINNDVNVQPKKIIRTEEVEKRTGLGRTTIYRRRKKGKFVTPVDLGNGRIGYYEHEIDEYLKNLERAPY